MAQKAITIYTPTTATPHINAEDDAQIYRAVFGGNGITEADNLLACTKVSDTSVSLDSGLFCNQGYMVGVSGGTTATLAVTAGSVGTYRKDYVVADFTRGGGASADTHVFAVVAGTPAATEVGAALPSLTQNDLSAGGARRQQPLFSILMSGTTLSTITRVADYVGSFYA
jgi:hypothetical protein